MTDEPKVIYTYRMEGIVQGMMTAWHEYGTDPDDACKMSVYDGVVIKKIVPLQVYDPMTGQTLPCPRGKI